MPQPTPPVLVLAPVLDVVMPDELELELAPPPGPALVEVEPEVEVEVGSPPWPLLVAIVDAVDDVVVAASPPVPGVPEVAPELKSSSLPRPPQAPAETTPAPSNAVKAHGAPRRNDP